MSRILLILSFLCVVSLAAFGQGSSIGNAVALSLNGSTGASMDTSTVGTNHYWKVTTTANGYLRIEVNSGSAIDVDVWLYDVNGTTSITSDRQSGTYSEVIGFLKPGTYYVNVWRYSGTSGSYTISNTFSSPSRPFEIEPNDSPATAVALSLSGTATGHIGFYSNGTTDTEDYWKITTTQNGWLRIQVRSDSLDLRGDFTLDLDIWLYDVNGTTSITFDRRSGTFSQVTAFLRPGTYYVNIWRYNGRAGSYEIKSEFFPPPLATEGEGNDTWDKATPALLNETVTGNIGYYTNGSTDIDDYWKFITTSDGKVVVQVRSDSLDRSGAPLDLDVWLYDVNGTTSVIFDRRSGPFSECVAYLRPGTYYVDIWRYSGNAGSYSLKLTHTPPPLANDVEGNDSPATASILTYGVSSSGHIGYYSSGTTDIQDYWKLVAPTNDSIYVNVTSELTLDLDVWVYGPDGTTSINSDRRSGVYSLVGFRPTAGTTYYVYVWRYSGSAGSYSILALRSSVVEVERESGKDVIPTEFVLQQNYPNPFNPTTTIRYGLPKEGKVQVAVYSILGQEVAMLQDGVQSAAYHTAAWNGKNSHGIDMPSGVYLIRLQADDKQIVRKAVLIR